MLAAGNDPSHDADLSGGRLDCNSAAPGAADMDFNDTIPKPVPKAGGAGGDAGDKGAGEVGDGKWGAEDTDDGGCGDSTVDEVLASECFEGGAAPAGREGELPFTLYVPKFVAGG